AEMAVHGGDMDAGLFEDPAMQHAHLAAAAPRAIPGRALENARRPVGMGAGDLALDSLEFGMDAVAQGAEPGAGGGFLGVDIGWQGHGGGMDLQESCVKSPICLMASPSTMAPASATLIERKPGRIGMRTRRSARSATSSGTPALSRPSNSTSPGA